MDYTLDASGRRAARTQGGVVTRYLYAGGLHPVAELNANYTVNRVFLYTSHSHVPDFVAVSTGGSSWSLWRVVTDHLGSVIGLTDAFGNPVFTRSYDAFGNIVAVTGSTAESDRFIFGFAGGLWDPTTKLIQFGARTYDPEIGRWLERDPSLHKGGVNLYDYAQGDPVNRIDVNGKWSGYFGVGGNAEASVLGFFGLGLELNVGLLFGDWGVGPYVTGGFAPGVVGASAGVGFQGGWARSKGDFGGAAYEMQVSNYGPWGASACTNGSGLTRAGVCLGPGVGTPSVHASKIYTVYPIDELHDVFFREGLEPYDPPEVPGQMTPLNDPVRDAPADVFSGGYSSARGPGSFGE